MKVFLGIDGGGTKTKFTLCRNDGRILAENTQPTSHYLQVGLKNVTQVLSDGLLSVCKMIPPEGITYAFVGCPGFGDTESMTSDILESVGKAMGPIPHVVGNDCESSLAGALMGCPGISLIAGTGSMACGKNDDGTILRCGGWHHAIGSDEGSGYWLSWRLLHEFTRQSDGRDKKTPLYQAVREALNMTADGDVITRVVDAWGMDRTKVASLSRLMEGLCDAGDPYANEILSDAARELSEMAGTLYQRLGFTGAVPVSYTGGVFRLGNRLLSPLGSLLAEKCMYLTAPLYPPDIGSLILAFRYSGTSLPERFS